ncbi:hypothetical protein RRJ51_00005 [Klebsiella pneumoniae]|uniref:hypothetical protein n=1 Tax=Klebsiella pneumoniae TaxID=573 RepID=UPI0028FC25F3|nr:hypothetical protein [Klebsiella pneumoniae]WNV96815.1 hypothetical protein RRJ51_00005 [Klebsiella pneumoniae]
MNISYQDEFTRLIRRKLSKRTVGQRPGIKLETVPAAKPAIVDISPVPASVAVGLARGALAFVGWSGCAATLGWLCITVFPSTGKRSPAIAIDLKDAVVETSESADAPLA